MPAPSLYRLLFGWLLGACFAAGCGDEALGPAFDAAVADAALDDAALPAQDAAPLPDAGPPEDFDAFVRYQMAVGGIPGLAVALLVDGEVAWRGFYGHQNIAEGIAVDEATSFPVASLSKMFTGVLAVQLANDGIAELDAPIDAALGFAPRHPSSDAPLTLRQLLTHTSGLKDNWLALGRVSGGLVPSLSLQEFSESYLLPGGAQYSADENFGLPPGQEHRYCNAAFGIAGAVLENAARQREPGASFPELAEARIFRPLGIQDSGFWPDAVPDERRAEAYSGIGGAITLAEAVGISHYPAGGLYSSLRDQERFALALLGDGRLGENEAQRILPEGTVESLFSLAVPALSSRQGLPFRRDHLAGRDYVGHSGATVGGSAEFLLHPEDGSGIIVLTNSSAYVLARIGLPGGRDAMNAILERLAGRLDTLNR